MGQFEIYKDDSKDASQCWRWQLLDEKRTPIAKSEEVFSNENIKASIKETRREVRPDTPIVLENSDEEDAKDCRFAYSFSEETDQWCWLLKAGGSNRTIAICIGGFVSEEDVKQAAEDVCSKMTDATIGWQNPEDEPQYPAKVIDDTTPKGIPGS